MGVFKLEIGRRECRDILGNMRNPVHRIDYILRICNQT
jgi:hypothetical protein